MNNQQHLMAACAAMVLLTLLVASRLLQNRVAEMKAKRIRPQETANSSQMAAKLQNIQAADNYRNLFEAPVLFYTLCGVAIGTGFIPSWLVVACWSFVFLRYLHSFIHCTYNKVMHRFPVFLSVCLLLYLLGFYMPRPLLGEGMALSGAETMRKKRKNK